MVPLGMSMGDTLSVADCLPLYVYHKQIRGADNSELWPILP